MPRARPELDYNGMTFGAEHEFGDWDTELGLPTGFARSPDYTIVNSNGIAAQPNPTVYRYGGEVNTPPTDTPQGQVACLERVLAMHQGCVVNYRSNLHVHIRVPGLKSSLLMLKVVQEYIHRELPNIIDLLEPIPRGQTDAERKRERRRRVSHHTFLTNSRLQRQLAATTVQEFFELEVPCSRAGRVMWYAQPRLAVGLRQMLQTDTIEFRHFPGTLDSEQLLTCVEWCRDFMLAALDAQPLRSVWQRYARRRFPTFPAFCHDTEVGYQATASHNGLNQAEIIRNIELILNYRFHGSKAEREAAARACGLPRQHL